MGMVARLMYSREKKLSQQGTAVLYPKTLFLQAFFYKGYINKFVLMYNNKKRGILPMKIRTHMLCLLALFCVGCAPYEGPEAMGTDNFVPQSYEQVWAEPVTVPVSQSDFWGGEYSHPISEEVFMNPEIVYQVTEPYAIREVYQPQEDIVALQNPQTRVLAYCYNVPGAVAEDCAREFEKIGFVRLRDIPRQPAQYDFLKEGTYPTRRWRNGEIVPRW